MNNLIQISTIINIVQIILFLIATFALFYKDAAPKTRADIATLNVIVLLLYFACFLVLFAMGFLKDENIYFISMLFILAPFIIGKIVRYQTLKMYSFVQFLVFCLSLVYLLNLHY